MEVLWKVSLKILNTGIILKTFTHVLIPLLKRASMKAGEICDKYRGGGGVRFYPNLNINI